MMDFTSRKKKSKKKNLKLGVPLEGTVTDVRWTKGFVEGSAYDVLYEIKDSSGNIEEFHETFFNDDCNDRTRAFEKFLNQNGIAYPSDFVGCNVMLTLLKEVKNNVAYVNIAQRKILSTPKGAPNVANS